MICFNYKPFPYKYWWNFWHPKIIASNSAQFNLIIILLTLCQRLWHICSILVIIASMFFELSTNSVISAFLQKILRLDFLLTLCWLNSFSCSSVVHSILRFINCRIWKIKYRFMERTKYMMYNLVPQYCILCFFFLNMEWVFKRVRSKSK